jgi:uncharacterized protein YjbI with pentapeptide repeats
MFRFRPGSMPVLALLVLTSGIAWYSGRAQANGQAAGLLPRVVLGEQFNQDPQLVAEPQQAILVTSDSLDPSGRFRLAAGLHRFCFNAAGRFFAGIAVEDALQRPVKTIAEQAGCVTATLPAGVYTVRLSHGENAIPDHPEVAEVRADPPLPALPTLGDPTDDDGEFGKPKAGYWAIQDNKFLKPGSLTGNRWHTLPPAPDSVVTIDSSQKFDRFSLFELPVFTEKSGLTVPIPFLDAPLGTFWNLRNTFSVPTSPYLFYVDDEPNCSVDCGYPGFGNIGFDLFNYRFTFSEYSYLTDNGNGLVAQSVEKDGPLVLSLAVGATPSPNTSDVFQVLFRFFPDGTQIGALQNTEAALYQGCNYTGAAAIFIPLYPLPSELNGHYPAYDLTAMSSDDTHLDGSARSIRLGNGVGVSWVDDGTTHVIINDNQCLGQSPTGHEFRVDPILAYLVNNKEQLHDSCKNCKLVGAQFVFPIGASAANFAGWNYTGADLSDATLTNVNLSGASLTNAKFDGAILTNVDLSGATAAGPVDFSNTTLNGVKFNHASLKDFNFEGATFCNVDFSGSDSSHLADLTAANFSGVNWLTSSGCLNNLSNTDLTPAQLAPQLWNDVNLNAAVFVDLQNYPLSSEQNPLDLSGIKLAGFSLEHAILDYAQGLSGADLTRTILNFASLQHVNLNGAKLYGAQLANANLDGANLRGVFLTKPPEGDFAAANLQGAFLRNVNLSQARISGANFSNASFYGLTPAGLSTCPVDPNTGFTVGCATAAGATMDATNFTNAYLYGVDFTEATAQGAQFGNAYLSGANFTGATLSVSTSGADTAFSGAFLQGANLGSVTLLNGLSLANAYVDFRPNGNALTLPISGLHTTFAGYWNTAGQPVCAQMIYSSPSILPTNNASITCPNGSQYPGGCGPLAPDGSNLNWESPVDISSLATYMYNATYTQAPLSGDQICMPDVKWNFGNIPKP